jgi:hypothetical protein
MISEPADKLKDELSRLIGCACDGLLTEEQRLRLNELLSQSSALRAHYLKYIAIHSGLTTTAGSQAARETDELRDRLASSGKMWKRMLQRRPAWRAVGGPLLRAAAILVVVVPPAYFVGKWIADTNQQAVSSALVVNQKVVVDDQVTNSQPARDQGKARVSRVSSEIRWQHPNESYTVDSLIRPGGRVRFHEGEIELVYESGVKLLLLGPVDFVLQEIGGELRRGGLMALVPQAGHGFTIGTPNGKVVDLGTEFGVMVDDFGVSEVSVFEGKVEAFPTSSNVAADGKIRLTKGSALQWNDEMLKSLEADSRRLPLTLASYMQPDLEQLATAASLAEEYRGDRLDTAKWLALGDVRSSAAGLILEGAKEGTENPYLVTQSQFDPTLGPVTVICEVHFPRLAPADVPSVAILTRSAADRTAIDRAWRDVLATCVRCNFRSAADDVDGVLETSTKFERDRELTSLSWRGFRRPQEGIRYRLVMRDDGVNVTFSVTQTDKPSITKTVICRSLFQGYENHIALEGWNRGAVIIDNLQIYQEPTDRRLANHAARFAAILESQPLRASQADSNPLLERVPARAALALEDGFDEIALNSKRWSVLGDVQVIDGQVSLGATKMRSHIDTFHPRPYLLTRREFVPQEGKLFVLGKIEFDDNFLQGYGGSFAVMSRSEGRYGRGPEWAISALGTGVRCNLWPAAPRADHTIEIHEKPTRETLEFLTGGTLPVNPRSRSYYFLMEDSGEEVAITFQDAGDPEIAGTIHHKTSNHAPTRGLIGFESTWGSRVLIDDVHVYVLESDLSEL